MSRVSLVDISGGGGGGVSYIQKALREDKGRGENKGGVD